MKIILWLHRYLGVVLGLLMLLWCVSGFVMMYQPFPEVSAGERIRGLPPFGPGERRDLSAVPLAEDAALDSFSVEMLGGRPVLHAGRQVFDIRTGAAVAVDEATARQTALNYARSLSADTAIGRAELIEFDQWSIQQRSQGPLWRFHFDGPERAIIHVSSLDGRVAQATTSRERFWTWLGAIPHWLYPTILRQHPGAWTQVVIWTSALGTFLTVLGLYVGVARFRRRPDGRWSPYRKVWLWHHYTGLAFGVLTLTWVFSGLLTMGPFGPLQSRPFPEARAINASTPWSEVRPALEAALARPDAAGLRRLETAPLGGETFVVAHFDDGRTLRLDGTGATADVTEQEVRAALDAVGGPLADASIELLSREDAYYYGHHNAVELPVWRVRTAEENPRRIYVSASNGRTLRTVDRAGAATRWLMSGLHSLDFPGLRARPVWDLVVVPLLVGVTLLCAIGVWLSWDRLRRDFRLLFRRRRARSNQAREFGR